METTVMGYIKVIGCIYIYMYIYMYIQGLYRDNGKENGSYPKP